MLLDSQLCDWLRMNSSGIYRPAAQAAIRIEELNEELVKANKVANYCISQIHDTSKLKYIMKLSKRG
jgi:hypothetical protein